MAVPRSDTFGIGAEGSVGQPTAVRSVNCPSCGRPSLFAPSNIWRPFCSQRCRSVDLGAWATERYRVAATPPVDDDESPARP